MKQVTHSEGLWHSEDFSESGLLPMVSSDSGMRVFIDPTVVSFVEELPGGKARVSFGSISFNVESDDGVHTACDLIMTARANYWNTFYKRSLDAFDEMCEFEPREKE